MVLMINPVVNMDSIKNQKHTIFFFVKIGVNDKSSCEYGFNQESETHYLLFCPCFVAQREILFDSVSQLVDQIQVVPFRSCRPFSSVQLLLSGCPDLGTQVTVQIFKQVQNYINDTARFLSGKR